MLDVAVELRFLAVFFAVVLLGQALLIGSWFAVKGVTRAVAVVSARKHTTRAAPSAQLSALGEPSTR